VNRQQFKILVIYSLRWLLLASPLIALVGCALWVAGNTPAETLWAGLWERLKLIGAVFVFIVAAVLFVWLFWAISCGLDWFVIRKMSHWGEKTEMKIYRKLEDWDRRR
jgi:hypothetical protein